MNRKIVSCLIFLTIFFYTEMILAKVTLPKLVSDSMVIQRDVKVKIWGWAEAKEKIKVKFRGKSYSTTTGADGKWDVLLPPAKAGGPYTMDISGASGKIT
jgi:sialate O-acetylesterase